MDNTSSSATIISNLNSIVETLIEELEQIKSSSVNLHDVDKLERLEIDLHEKTNKIAILS